MACLAAAGPPSSQGNPQTRPRAAKASFSAFFASLRFYWLSELARRLQSSSHRPSLNAPTLQRSNASTPAFSLIEILVTTALLSFIIIGLVAMFGQTQRAFTQSLTDVDLLENGRASMDLMVRDLAEAGPANIANAVNFYVEVPQPTERIYTPPLLQGLPGTVNPPQQRINYLQPFYFLSHPNQMWPDRVWVETGYYVVPDVRGVGIGTLYRYTATNAVPPLPLSPAFPANVLNPGPWGYPLAWGSSFLSSLSTLRTDTSPVLAGPPYSTVMLVAEGVVHLRVRPFATNGFPIVSSLNPLMYGYTAFLAGFWTNINNVVTYVTNAQPILEATNHLNLGCPDRYDGCWFLSNAVPACVELELGILELQTYQRYKAIASDNPAAGAVFLSNHVAQVHLFRQRVPIHNVDPSAY
jgi:type II secretory pathway pseudopilin PulG